MVKHIVLVCIGLFIISGCQSQTKANKDEPRPVSQTQSDVRLPADATMRYDERNGSIFRMEGSNLSQYLQSDTSFQQLQSENRFSDIAIAFIAAYRRIFKLQDPSEEFRLISFNVEGSGQKHIRFSQFFMGIPIKSSEMIVHLNRFNQVHLVEARYIPTPSGLVIQPKLSEAGAFRKAAQELNRQDCPNCRSELMIFPDNSSKPHLAYRVSANAGVTQAWEIFIDAHSGEMLAKLSAVHSLGIPQMK